MSFEQAPKNGPPPGRHYNTIGYGLFQSFKVDHVFNVGHAGESE